MNEEFESLVMSTTCLMNFHREVAHRYEIEMAKPFMANSQSQEARTSLSISLLHRLSAAKPGTVQAAGALWFCFEHDWWIR
jgi:hypothetical protein